MEPAAKVEKNERIGYLPEESYLYRFLNAEETLDFYGRLFNIDPEGACPRPGDVMAIMTAAITPAAPPAAGEGAVGAEVEPMQPPALFPIGAPVPAAAAATGALLAHCDQPLRRR